VKPARLRESAERDILQAFAYYLKEAPHVAEAFTDAVVRGRRHIEDNPGAGSPRYGEILEAPGLRFWLLNRFPYVLFYVERDDHLDVIRVLHQHADIPQKLDDDFKNS
jgi:toxin ParE1/3/4